MVRNKMMKFEEGDVVSHRTNDNSLGLVVATMPAYPSEDSVIRDISGNSYQVYWSVAPPGEQDLAEDEEVEREQEGPIFCGTVVETIRVLCPNRRFNFPEKDSEHLPENHFGFHYHH